MLRASCEESGIAIDLSCIVDDTAKCDVEHAALLLAFADSVLATGPDAEPTLENVRAQLVANLGEARMSRAAGVVANFQMMNRALDVLGAQFGRELSPSVVELAAVLDMQVPSHWGNH